MEKGPESRVAIKGEVKRKKKASRSKKSRRKYRALDEAKAASRKGPDLGGETDEVDDEENSFDDSDAQPEETKVHGRG